MLLNHRYQALQANQAIYSSVNIQKKTKHMSISKCQMLTAAVAKRLLATRHLLGQRRPTRAPAA